MWEFNRLGSKGARIQTHIEPLKFLDNGIVRKHTTVKSGEHVTNIQGDVYQKPLSGLFKMKINLQKYGSRMELCNTFK